jgi:hypothetical protein
MSRFSKSRREALELQLRPLVEVQCLQQRVVASILGVSEDWVQRACNRLELATQRTGPRAGVSHPGWKGGTVIRKGYRFVYAPDHPFATKNKQVAEHRLVMERLIGRYLRRTEVVHHIDGNPLNNAPNNLELFESNASHLKNELTGKTPKWTESGKRKIEEGIRKAAATHRKIKSDDDLLLLSSDHPT